MRRADLKSQLLFGWLLLLTLLIAFGHSQVKITTLIYLYFVFHAFRDEIYIYQERRSGFRFRGRVFDAGGYAVFIGAFALAFLNFLAPRNSSLQSEMHYVLTAAAGILAALAVVRRPQRLFANRPGLRYALPAVFLAVAAMTGMEVLRWHGWNAPLFFSFLVIFHYFSWYVFSLEKMAARSKTPQGSTEVAGSRMQWMQWMGRRPGFIKAIIAMNLLSFAAAWSYHVLHASTKLAYIFDVKYFLYFLVLHVTTSFVPRSSTRISEARNRGEWDRTGAVDPMTVESSGS